MAETIILGILAIVSIISGTFIVERALALRWSKVIPAPVEQAVERCRTRDDLPKLVNVCERRPSPLGRLLLVAADHLEWPKAENVDLIQTRARQEINRLERGLIVLEIATGIAPLLGLVGTVYGMIALFSSIGETGLTDSASFASGISIALKATLFGLLIAIPSLISWSYFSKKLEDITVEMETVCDEFIRCFYRQEILAAKAAPTVPTSGSESGGKKRTQATASSKYSQALQNASSAPPPALKTQSVKPPLPRGKNS